MPPIPFITDVTLYSFVFQHEYAGLGPEIPAILEKLTKNERSQIVRAHLTVPLHHRGFVFIPISRFMAKKSAIFEK